MSDQPPPPPPHGGPGGGPKSGGLPPGKYDIFVIPEHSAGGGFLYLPSLQPNINSFVAGFASALILVVLGQSMAPAFRTWWESFQGLGNMGIVMLIIGVGFGAWSLGRTQQDGGSFGSSFRPKPNASSGGGSGPGGSQGFPGAHPGATPNPDGTPPPPPPHGGTPGASGGHQQHGGPPPPHGTRQHGDGYHSTSNTPPPHQQYTPPPPRQESTPPPPPPPREPSPPPPKPQEQKPPPPKPEPPKPEPKKETPKSAWERARDQYKGSWERAREETRKKEEERKAKEAEQKRREETAKRLAELRAKEAKERQQREMEKQRREREAKEKEERLKAEQRAKELSEKLERERKERERLEREFREREEQRKREEEESKSKKGSSYAFSGVGEKMSMWPNGKPPVPKHTPSPSVASRNTQSPEKKAPAPTAKTYVSEETHSYRPYDQPKKPRKKSVSSFAGSESSWAPSQTTTRTSPPPSMRGPYSTKDPDKIVISAVYLFMNQFAKTPASQLISGVGTVTDGLILRITTEGLFIDDDVRGVPQREWDVKAWTLKQVEVWCPPHCLDPSSSSTPSKPSPNLLHKMAQSRASRNNGGAGQPLTGDNADVFLTEMLRACNDCCRLGLCERAFRDGANVPRGQTGEWKAKGLHVLRATLRDQGAKRYLFIIDEAEAWKMTVGLQRLRKGTQVRQLGVSGMSAAEARGTLEMLGWGT